MAARTCFGVIYFGNNVSKNIFISALCRSMNI